jgi:hypothetical protein
MGVMLDINDIEHQRSRPALSLRRRPWFDPYAASNSLSCRS